MLPRPLMWDNNKGRIIFLMVVDVIIHCMGMVS
jgi:hypothetical protein